MYPGFDVSVLMPDAEKFVMENDRGLLDPFFKAAERFCAENKALLGGRVGTDLLARAPLSKDSYFWEIYIGRAFDAAKQLAHELSEVKSAHVPGRTVALRTDIRGRELTIFINTLQVMKIYGMDEYHGVNLIDVLRPGKVTGYYGMEVYVIPEEIQLVDIYRSLYSPSRLSSWERCLQMEPVIYRGLRERVSKIVVRVGGGDGGGDTISRRTCDELLIRKYIADSQTRAILIGDHAIDITLSRRTEGQKRLQFITAEPIDDVVARVEKILIRDKNAARKVGVPFEAKVTAARFNMNIPSDFQIQKYTLYITRGRDDQLPIADVYNSTEYEIVPWREEKVDGAVIHIGNVFVLLKFILIDVWAIRLIVGARDGAASDSLHRRVLSLLDSAEQLRMYFIGKADIAELFQLENYTGVSISEAVAKKKLIKNIGERFRTYYPALEG